MTAKSDDVTMQTVIKVVPSLDNMIIL